MAAIEMQGKDQALVGKPTLFAHEEGRKQPDDSSTDPSDYYEICGGSADTFAMRQLVGLALSFGIALVFLVLEITCGTEQDPCTEDEHKQNRCLGIFLVVIVFWLCEVIPIPITGVLVGPMLFLFDVFSFADALKSYMTNLTLMLFGSYFIAIAMERHGLDRRFANTVTNLPFVAGVAWRERLAMMGCGWILSMWLSNAGSTSILTPIMLRSQGIVRGQVLPPGPTRQAVVGGLLAVAYGCNSGGMATLVGGATNVIAQTALESEGISIDFFTWMLFGIPVSFLVACSAYIVLYFIYKPAEREVSEEGVPDSSTRSGSADDDAIEKKGTKSQGPMSWGEKVVLTCFLATVFFWLLPSLYNMLGFQNIAGFPSSAAVKDKLRAGLVVCLCSIPMMLLPEKDSRNRILPWTEAKKANWGIIMLVGGGNTLGNAVTDTGVADNIATGILNTTGVGDVWTLTFLVIFLTVFFTEVTSNIPATNIMVPIVIALSKTIDPDPYQAIGPVIGTALAASCAFMLPIATPPNYIVMDTGHLKVSDMTKAGFFVNLMCIVVLWVVLRVLVPMIFAAPSQA